MARRRRTEEDDDHDEGAERWLVTYADMLTLLMVLFIILFAMSTVDDAKYQQLKNGLADGFGRSLSILDGASRTIEDKGSIEQAGTSYDQLVDQLPRNERAAVQQAVDRTERLRTQRQYADAKNEVDRLVRLWHRMRAALRAHRLEGDVQAGLDERGLVVSLVSRHVVFEPNVADLSARGQRLVDTIAPVLADISEPLEIDGHTNQVKVMPKYYPTDWELSAARAVTVLRRLQEVDGLPARRLSATGYGHTRPLVDPRKPGAQTVNKRADIVVLSQAPAATRALLARAGRELTSQDPSDAEGQ
jgi:chemotaxis protein MotB